MQWFLSPTLEEGNHTITLTGMDGTDVDYALVGVGNQTTVIGKDVLVDSPSDSIIWVGDWQTNTSTLLTDITVPYIVHRPLGNSTKDSRTVGDSFSFQFTGQLRSHLRYLQLDTIDRDERIRIRGPEEFNSRSHLR